MKQSNYLSLQLKPDGFGFCSADEHGTVYFHDIAAEGSQNYALYSWILKYCKAHPITHIAVADMRTAYETMPGIVCSAAERLGATYCQLDHHAIMRFATGRDSATPTEMIFACKDQYGIEPQTEQEATAIHLYHAHTDNTVQQ